MNIITTVSRWLVGILFIISGLIKLNDPIGTAIKMQEYFEVFSTEIWSVFHYFVPLSLFLAVFLTVLEVVLGIAVLIKYKMPQTTWVLFALIIFFTLLTFYSAFTGNVTDCGCFGDAIKLTPWESFIKDVVLVVFIGFLFFKRKEMKPVLAPLTGHLVIAFTTITNIFIGIYAINHLPYIDFRAYKVGTNIAEAMQPSETLKYLYIMTKDGEEHEFEQYPTDTTYKFKEMIVMNPEANPKITDYNVWNDDGDFTNGSLEGIKLIVISYDVRKADVESFQQINKLVAGLDGTQVETLAFTASETQIFENFRHEMQFAVPYYFADATVLKTIIRSNPGIILLDNGMVKGKWHFNDVPEANEVLNLTR